MPQRLSFLLKAFNNVVWHPYKSYVKTSMQLPVPHTVNTIKYWQHRLFINTIVFALPASLLALIPCVWMEYRAKHFFLMFFDVAVLAVVAIIVLNRNLSLQVRKIIVIGIVACFAVTLTVLIGSFSIGCIYLFSLSVFVALQFSDGVAYGMQGFNLLYCLSFALLLYYKQLVLPLIANITFERWVIYSVNFLFMNLVITVLIRQTLNGMIRTMRKEAWLLNELENELILKATLNSDLQSSEEQYKTLFFQSPSPKIIFDIDSLKLLQVNDAAINNYGYTEAEFLNMTLKDLHPDEDINEVTKQVHTDGTNNTLLPYTALHIGKNGRRIHTEISRANITFKGKNARMIVANDITQRVRHTKAIQEQNGKLQDIAHLQSHVIRLPLARIMAITELINQEYNGKIDPQLLDYLNTSAHELDAVIRDIVAQSADVMARQHDTD